MPATLHEQHPGRDEEGMPFFSLPGTSGTRPGAVVSQSELGARVLATPQDVVRAVRERIRAEDQAGAV
ncbi:hypothetical protein [Streptomyces avermitilis]|uniref:hypothetical protein n=1 Tax=Streptomyces avermitilis TaxID=33903 RepID=UPI00380AE8BF